MKWQPLVVELRVTAVSRGPKDLETVIQFKHVAAQVRDALKGIRADVRVKLTQVASNTVYLSSVSTHQVVWTITPSRTGLVNTPASSESEC